MIVTTLPKVAAIKFLMEEGVACEMKMTPDNVERLNCAATIRKRVVVEGGEGISENRPYDNIKICIDPKIQRSLGLEKDIFSFCHERATRGIGPQTFGFPGPLLYH